MRNLLRHIFFLFYKPYALWQISAPRTYRFGQFTLQVPKGVFHPGLFFSTHFLLDELLALGLRGKTFLELGSGSGLISIAAAHAGAVVTAVDVSALAVNATRQNAAQNKLAVEVIESDLFAALPGRRFDVVAINPPYFKKHPAHAADAAWFAGKNYEYFKKLFAQLGAHIKPTTTILMVASQDVDIPLIQSIAAQHNFKLILSNQKIIYFEKNFVYKVISA